MTTTLYVDTATTGAWLYREPSADARQPHLCRLAVLAVTDGREEAAWCRLIRPMHDWIFEPEAVAKHGVAAAMAIQDGIPLRDVWAEFSPLLDVADELVAYNLDFHWRVLERTAAEIDAPLSIPPPHAHCAMRRSTNIVRKPRMQPGGGYAWPKQSEALAFFGAGQAMPTKGDPLDRGMASVRATRVIYEGIQQFQGSR